ncbi:MAG: hypothetical protein K2N43_06010, partial [Lachnospiraceae bacterium]|nr:hypothetical protein [Lachnospiraceae bacterium]
MRAEIFEVLVTSSVLIVGILGLRKLTMGKISMRLRYSLWLLVAVRLLMPVSVGTSPVSVMNLVSGVLQGSVFSDGRENVAKADETYAAQMKEGDTENAFAWQNPAQEANGQHQNMIAVTDESQKNPGSSAVVSAKGETVSRKDISPVYVIWAVWFSGVLAVGWYMLFMRARFVRYLRRNRHKIAGKEIPAAIREKLVGRGMRVYRVKGLPSPCLVGKRIYIGQGLPEEEQRLTHILAHEYCHRVHGDGFWAFLRCALAAVYWFDPLVWAAAFAERQDSDLDCYESVVRLL